MDLALGSDEVKVKVIEFNYINASGFYDNTAVFDSLWNFHKENK